jgi:hypothetical protein
MRCNCIRECLFARLSAGERPALRIGRWSTFLVRRSWVNHEPPLLFSAVHLTFGWNKKQAICRAEHMYFL